MRAKLKVLQIISHKKVETVQFTAVGKDGGYPEDGSDEDNTFAKFTPQATFDITITNPELLGTFKVGDSYYVDFTAAE